MTEKKTLANFVDGAFVGPTDGGGGLYLAIEQAVVGRMRAGATPVSLFAGVAALENVQRPRFVLRGLAEVHRPSAVSLQLLVGAEARLF